MYIIAIAWLYVALMVSIADTSVVGGVMTFLFSGLAPLALFLWIFGAPARKRTRLARERQESRQRDAPTEPAGRQTRRPTDDTDSAGLPGPLSRKLSKVHSSHTILAILPVTLSRR